jgi:beta-lactamase class A
MIYRTATIVISLALITTGLFNCSSPKKTTRSTVPVNNPKAPVPSPMEEPAPIVNPKSTAKTDPFLEDLLAKHPNYFQRFLQQRDSFRLQIIYTQIDRKANNKPVFKDYYFNVNPDQYFYPASTVKMPTALLALQKLNELKVDGLDKNTCSTIPTAPMAGQPSPIM